MYPRRPHRILVALFWRRIGGEMLRWYMRVALVLILVAVAIAGPGVESVEFAFGGRGFKW
jgi:hypothetical protein